ncbi:MAG: CapA family protein [Actinophytocola sp.]|nr:CapA family protein [Actinophytocola sp.]
MLGRGVAEQLNRDGPFALFDDDIRAIAADADLVVANLECCISDRGAKWDPRHKPFHFRAPPSAVETLIWLGVDCVTLANNHALDYGHLALADTRRQLADAGIAVIGVGDTEADARSGVIRQVGDEHVAILGIADHPADFAASERAPGTAFADLYAGTPRWLTDRVRELAAEADIVIVTPHWGPNMTTAPRRHVRRAARDLVDAGATLVAGHSAHVFHGVAGRVLYDLGDVIDDYVRDPVLRNDLGLLVLVDVAAAGPVRLEAWPLKLDCAHTGLAHGDDADWVRHRFTAACHDLGTAVAWQDDRLVIDWG